MAVCPVAEYALLPEKLNVPNYGDVHLVIGHTISSYFHYSA